MSTFLYRSPFLPKENENQIYHETNSLRFYRTKLEEKATSMTAQIIAFPGLGAPINLLNKTPHNAEKIHTSAVSGNKSGIEFLEQYRNDIAALPTSGLNEKEKQIFTTLLPTAAALKHRGANNKSTAELIEETKHHCVMQIDKILSF
jgi:hypothetical protein